jgi:hypothetical protein
MNFTMNFTYCDCVPVSRTYIARRQTQADIFAVPMEGPNWTRAMQYSEVLTTKPASLVKWLGQKYLGKRGLVSTNPGPKLDYTKLTGVRVFHLNIGSRLETRVDRVRDILEKFSCKTIFTITESGLTKALPNDTLKIRNFNLYRNDNAIRKSLGMLIYWSKDKVKDHQKIYDQLHVSRNKRICARHGYTLLWYCLQIARRARSRVRPFSG